MKWREDRLKQVKIVGMRTKYDFAIMSKKDLRGLSANASNVSIQRNPAIHYSVDNGASSVRRSQRVGSLKNL
jgi:hypothetical protein